MLKEEWLKEQKEEINKENPSVEETILIFLLKIIEECLSQTKSNFEIDNDKTVKNCYKEMEKYARKNQVSGCYCFSEEQTKEFVKNYFNIVEIEENKIINLSDFI